MAKAQITLPDGLVVNVTGTPDEITAVVGKLQGKPTAPGAARASAQPAKAKGGRVRVQLPDLVGSLIDGGFFKKPKDLAAIKGALEEMGHHYPVTTLSATMLREVRKRSLRRLKQDNKWMYTG